jgi:hypothetical protein
MLVDEGPLPAATKAYLEAFDGYLCAWAAEDERAMLHADWLMAERLPAVLGLCVALVGVIPRGSRIRGRGRGSRVTLLLPA